MEIEILLQDCLASLNTLINTIDEAYSERDKITQAIKHYGTLKGRLGGSTISQKLGLNEQELRLFDASIRDMGRRVGSDQNDLITERNTRLSILRFLSWIETIASRVPSIALPESIQASITEDIGRKQVRAIELIIRSLIDEKFGSQTELEAQLKKFFKSEVVDKWKKSGDQNNLLSGTTFSELASLFVNKQEFPNYEKIFTESDYLKFLKDKRKTIQDFLEDIRRVRNTLAHNKTVSNVQLSLLDLYYEELIAPIQESYDHGTTRVDPSLHIDVSAEELSSYFSNLREDLDAIKDDIADFRESVESALGVISEDTSEIKETTHDIKSKTTLIIAGVVVVLIGVGLTIYFTGSTKQDTQELKQQTVSIQQTVEDTSKETQKIGTTIHKIDKNVESLGKSGGLILKPESAQDYFNNAQVYEKNGDRFNALQDYENYLNYAEDEVFYDPIQKFIELLDLSYSKNKVKARLSELSKKFPNSLPLQLEIIRYESTETDNVKLIEFVNAHPRYIPGHLALISATEDKNDLESMIAGINNHKRFHSNIEADLVKEQYINPAASLVNKVEQLLSETPPSINDLIRVGFDYNFGKKLYLWIYDEVPGKRAAITFSDGQISVAELGLYGNPARSASFFLKEKDDGGSNSKESMSIAELQLRRSIKQTERSLSGNYSRYADERRDKSDTRQKEKLTNLKTELDKITRAKVNIPTFEEKTELGSEDVIFHASPGNYYIKLEYIDSNNKQITLFEKLLLTIPAYNVYLKSYTNMGGTESFGQKESWLIIEPFEDTDSLQVSGLQSEEFIEIKPLGPYLAPSDMQEKLFRIDPTTIGIEDITDGAMEIWFKDSEDNPFKAELICEDDECSMKRLLTCDKGNCNQYTASK